MKPYKVILTLRARQDIQETIKWYNSRQRGLGRKFHAFLKLAISTIKASPFYEVRYAEIRCFKIKRFPYLIHFIVEQDTVYVLAVICTHRDPEKHWLE